MRTFQSLVIFLRATLLALPLALVTGCPDSPGEEVTAPAPGTITPALGQPSGGGGPPGPAPSPQPRPPSAPPADPPSTSPPGTIAPVVGTSAPGSSTAPRLANAFLGQDFDVLGLERAALFTWDASARAHDTVYGEASTRA